MTSTNEHSNLTRTAPRRAVLELPDQAAVDAAGINLDLERARLVSCVIFRQAARGRSKTRMSLYDTIMGLVFLGRQAIERNGTPQPAPFPDLPTNRWPQGKEILRHLGITHRDLEAYCGDARRRADDACLPLEWALAFFPAAIWPMIACLIEWGPEHVGLRMEWAAETMAKTPRQRTTRRRTAGEPLSDSTVQRYINGVWQLMDVLIELRSIATKSPVLPLDLLDAWTTKPKPIDARAHGARPAELDNSGPSLEACSTRLKELRAEARVTTQRNGYVKRRRALWMELLCLFGAREDAFLNTRVEDYIPGHRYPNSDTGPVLRIYPAKTWDPDEAHYLPLPAEVAGDIEEWIAFTGRTIGQPGEPLFPSRKPKPGTTNTYMTTHGFYNGVAGAHQKGGTGSYALLPRGDDPFIGYHPHSFRHTALQLAVRAASNLQRADAMFFPHVHPQEFGKAIVGHELVTEVGGVYRDLDRQLLCRAVVDEMWRLLREDGVLRRGPDPEQIRRAREQRDTLQTTIRALGGYIRELEAKAAQATDRAAGIRDQNRSLKLQLQGAQLQLEARAKRDELAQLERSLDRAEAELDDAKTTLVPIPDHISDAEHARQIADALGQPSASQPGAPPVYLTDEISVNDAAELFAVDEHTIRRWRKHGFPKHRPTPWYGGEEAWHDHTQKDRRLRVGAINLDGLTQTQLQLLEQLRLKRALEDSGGRGASPGVDAESVGGQLDAWETSGSSPPDDLPVLQEVRE